MSTFTETIACYVCGQVHAINAQCCADRLNAPRTSLRPLGARVLVTPDPPKRRSALLETVEYATPPETSGEVVGVGKRFLCEGCQALRPVTLRPGDRVLFPPTAGQDVRIGEKTYIILDERDVLAVVGQE